MSLLFIPVRSKKTLGKMYQFRVFHKNDYTLESDLKTKITVLNEYQLSIRIYEVV